MFRTLKPLLLILLLSVAGFAQVAWAGNFVPIVPIPGIDYGNVDMEEYLKVLYILAISFAALLAVGQLVLAGFQFITSEIVTDREEAKKRIRAAIVGLFIILIAVTVLRTINPDLANLPALSKPPKPEITRPTAQTVRPGDDSARDIQDQLDQCENTIRYNDNTRCCNDNNSCDPPPTTSNTLTGLSETKNVYTPEEITNIVEQNGGEERVVDLGPSLQGFNEQQLEEQCQMASESRGKTLEEVVTLYQVTVSNNIRNIAERTLCVMQTNGGTAGGSDSGTLGYDPNTTYTYVESVDTGDPLAGETFTIVGWNEQGVSLEIFWDDASLNSDDGSPAIMGCGGVQPKPSGCL